ncbi:MAG: TIGR03987 family protein [Spirochaetales bacterium]|nr:TIGR03987 family protein [Spirochaetales bacterium]
MAFNLFWIGFLYDTTGTTLMGIMSSSFTLSVHAVTGVLAIVLMAFHAVWATIVLIKKNEALLRNFHKFSIVV